MQVPSAAAQAQAEDHRNDITGNALSVAAVLLAYVARVMLLLLLLLLLLRVVVVVTTTMIAPSPPRVGTSDTCSAST
jgi:hypothetical protein